MAEREGEDPSSDSPSLIFNAVEVVVYNFRKPKVRVSAHPFRRVQNSGFHVANHLELEVEG